MATARLGVLALAGLIQKRRKSADSKPVEVLFHSSLSLKTPAAGPAEKGLSARTHIASRSALVANLAESGILDKGFDITARLAAAQNPPSRLLPVRAR